MSVVAVPTGAPGEGSPRRSYYSRVEGVVYFRRSLIFKGNPNHYRRALGTIRSNYQIAYEQNRLKELVVDGTTYTMPTGIQDHAFLKICRDTVHIEVYNTCLAQLQQSGGGSVTEIGPRRYWAAQMKQLMDENGWLYKTLDKDPAVHSDTCAHWQYVATGSDIVVAIDAYDLELKDDQTLESGTTYIFAFMQLPPYMTDQKGLVKIPDLGIEFQDGSFVTDSGDKHYHNRVPDWITEGNAPEGWSVYIKTCIGPYVVYVVTQGALSETRFTRHPFFEGGDFGYTSAGNTFAPTELVREARVFARRITQYAVDSTAAEVARLADDDRFMVGSSLTKEEIKHYAHSAAVLANLQRSQEQANTTRLTIKAILNEGQPESIHANASVLKKVAAFFKNMADVVGGEDSQLREALSFIGEKALTWGKGVAKLILWIAETFRGAISGGLQRILSCDWLWPFHPMARLLLKLTDQQHYEKITKTRVEPVAGQVGSKDLLHFTCRHDRDDWEDTGTFTEMSPQLAHPRPQVVHVDSNAIRAVVLSRECIERQEISPAHKQILKKAFNFVSRKLKAQLRKSGIEYVEYPGFRSGSGDFPRDDDGSYRLLRIRSENQSREDCLALTDSLSSNSFWLESFPTLSLHAISLPESSPGPFCLLFKMRLRDSEGLSADAQTQKQPTGSQEPMREQAEGSAPRESESSNATSKPLMPANQSGSLGNCTRECIGVLSEPNRCSGVQYMPNPLARLASEAEIAEFERDSSSSEDEPQETLTPTSEIASSTTHCTLQQTCAVRPGKGLLSLSLGMLMVCSLVTIASCFTPDSQPMTFGSWVSIRSVTTGIHWLIARSAPVFSILGLLVVRWVLLFCVILENLFAASIAACITYRVMWRRSVLRKSCMLKSWLTTEFRSWENSSERWVRKMASSALDSVLEESGVTRFRASITELSAPSIISSLVAKLGSYLPTIFTSPWKNSNKSRRLYDVALARTVSSSETSSNK